VQKWVERNWSATIFGKISIRFCGRGYYTFHFETKEDRDLIFRNDPYFMDTRGLYLNRWTPNFDPEMDVPNVVPVWVRLSHLPLHCWGDDSVKAIENAVGKYIDRCEPKENMHAYTQICVEVDLGKGLPEAIKIKVDQWTHIQQLDYKKIPFKCKVCHEYGHFSNRCTKNREKENEKIEDLENKWEQVKRKKIANKQPAEPTSQPSHSAEALTLLPKVTVESQNPFDPLPSSNPPYPGAARSRSRSRTPCSPSQRSPLSPKDSFHLPLPPKWTGY